MQEQIGHIRRIQDILVSKLKNYLEKMLISERHSETNLDFLGYLNVLKNNWESIAVMKSLDRIKSTQIKNIIFATIDLRNRYAHLTSDETSEWDLLRDYDTLYRFAEVITADPQVLDQIEGLRRQQVEIVRSADSNSTSEEVLTPPEQKSKSDQKRKKKVFPQYIHLEESSMKVKLVDDSDYKKDILSLPAGKTIHIVEKIKIHSCPDKPRDKETEEEYKRKYIYKKSQYIALRTIVGEMKFLYRIDKILTTELEQKDDLEKLVKEAVRQNLLTINEEKRMLDYCNSNPFMDNERFYIFSEEDIIDLPHNPMPNRDTLLPLYYSLDEILSGRKVVLPDLSL